jgi:hypothetical protein
VRVVYCDCRLCGWPSQLAKRRFFSGLISTDYQILWQNVFINIGARLLEDVVKVEDGRRLNHLELA